MTLCDMETLPSLPDGVEIRIMRTSDIAEVRALHVRNPMEFVCTLESLTGSSLEDKTTPSRIPTRILRAVTCACSTNVFDSHIRQ